MTDENGANRRLGEALGGRPNVLILADFTCRTLCGPILAIVAAGLAKTGLQAGRDFGLVVVGLDPKDSADDARAMRRDQIGDGALAAASTFLRGDEAAVRQIAQAIGYQLRLRCRDRPVCASGRHLHHDGRRARFTKPCPASRLMRPICGSHWSKPAMDRSGHLPITCACCATASIPPKESTRSRSRDGWRLRRR